MQTNRLCNWRSSWLSGKICLYQCSTLIQVNKLVSNFKQYLFINSYNIEKTCSFEEMYEKTTHVWSFLLPFIFPWKKIVFFMVHLYTILPSIFHTNWSAISSANLRMLADAQTSLFDFKELGFYLFYLFFPIDKTSCYFQGKAVLGLEFCMS